MKRMRIGLAIAMLAAGCSSGGDDAGEPVSTTATTVADANSGSEPTSGPDATTPPETADELDRPLSVWVPSSLALDTFVEVAVTDAAFEVAVTESPASYPEIEAAAVTALETHDLLLVPATIGEALVSAGQAELAGRVFEDEDPDVAVTQLGVWLLQPTSPITGFARPRQQLSPEASEVVDFVIEEGKALDDSARQGAAFGAAGDLVGDAAQRYGARVGGSVGARTIAKFAGPVAAVLDFLKTMHDFTVAANEAIEADSNARISLYDTGMSATGMISDARTQLCSLEPLIISGEVSPQEAQELVERLNRSISRASNIAVETAFDLGEAGDEVQAAQIDQLRERQLDSYFKKSAEIIDEIDRRIAAGTPVVISPSADDALKPLAAKANALEQFAQIFAPTEENNESMHSNGSLTVVSEGETDITGVGQVWWAPGLNGPGLDTLLPCDGGTGQTLCGDRSYDGPYTVAFATFGGDVLTDPGRIYQYAFVFDRDRSPGDNYIARAPYAYDTWDGSDIRYEIYQQGGSAGLSVTEGSNFAQVDTAARVLISGDALVAVIPDDELAVDDDDPAVPMRVTSFWHFGDFGEGPGNEFNIDLFPVVGQPYWEPSEIVTVTGPTDGPSREPVDVMPLDNVRADLGRQLSQFAPTQPTVPDLSQLADIDECAVTEYFTDNPTVLSVVSDAYDYEGTTVQVRYELHDSESAARGAFGLASSTVTLGCRQVLLERGSTPIDTIARPAEGPNYSWDNLVLGGDAAGLQTSTFAGFDGPVFVRVTTVGPDGAPADQIIADVFESTFVP